nr:Chain C, peptide [synthetic construct]6Q0N_D Chain D, peptide [synthetic construct]
TGYETWV